MKTASLTLFFLFFSCLTFGQTYIKGSVRDENNKPIQGVNVTQNSKGTTTDLRGNYELQVVGGVEIEVVFSHISFETFRKKIKIPNNKTFRFSPKLKPKTETIDEVLVEANKSEVEGMVSVNAEDATKIPGANPGIENLLMTLPGVNNNNELSTQYNVRGGNFDENLVYVNGIEIYRPFLARSGQQEGLSFINEHLVQNVKFSAGGFQAKYGDKLSSVLDVTYRSPSTFRAMFDASLLGASGSLEGTLFKDKLQVLLGIRYRDNSLFINSKDTETNANPNFTDGQLFLKYNFNEKFDLSFLGNISLNNYNYQPLTRRTRFGPISDPKEFTVFYQGNEEDSFETYFGALKAKYQWTETLNVSLNTSIYHTQEEEFYDILAAYQLESAAQSNGPIEIPDFSNGIGAQLNHARNELDALIYNAQLNAQYRKDKHLLEGGIKYQKEDIRDHLNEWEVIDSLGFSVRPDFIPGNNQPYEPFTGPIVPFQHINAQNNANIQRFEAFMQYSKQGYLDIHKIWYNFGVRSHSWTISSPVFESNQGAVFSVRGQFAIKPYWKKDMLFRIAAGMYHQPPFYKEYRNHEGELVPSVDAQKSNQIVLGHEYSFKLWDRPFKLISEAYFKGMKDVNTYTVDNVKIRYAANNNAVAYATGLDLRLHGEFVPGTQSWISLGFLKTEENSADRGYIARPTDQRVKFAMLFQDYVPNIPRIRMYLNLMFNTGVPGGAPSYADPYDYQGRLNSYQRADIGISYVFTDAQFESNAGWLDVFDEFVLGVEIFNMFDNRNSITTTWVRDAYSKQYYGIPNYMTPRLFNVKLGVKF